MSNIQLQKVNESGLVSSINPLQKANEIINRLDVAENTRRDYSYRIPHFINYVSTEGFDRYSYLNYKKLVSEKTEWGLATKNKYLATARVFLRELSREGLIPDITANVRSFKVGRGHRKQGLTTDEILKVEKHIDEMESSKDRARIKALFYLLAFQGLRSVEVVRLTAKDFSHSEGTLLVQGKGELDKTKVHLHPLTSKAIKDYMKVAKIKDGSLFVSFSNRSSERLTPFSIQRLFKGMFESLGIDKSTHGFRHFYITNLLNNGFDVRTVRKFSRHKTLDMLIVYDDEIEIHQKAQEVFKAFNRLNVEYV